MGSHPAPLTEGTVLMGCPTAHPTRTCSVSFLGPGFRLFQQQGYCVWLPSGRKSETPWLEPREGGQVPAWGLCFGQPHTELRGRWGTGRHAASGRHVQDQDTCSVRARRPRGRVRRVTASCRSYQNFYSGPPLGWESCFQPLAPRCWTWPWRGLYLRWTHMTHRPG